MMTGKQELQKVNTTNIQHEFSEQYKLPSEMLEDNSEKEKSTKQKLKDFNYSLEEFVNKYAKSDTDILPKKRNKTKKKQQ